MTEEGKDMEKSKKRIRPLRFIKKYGRLLLGGTIIFVVLFVAIFAPLLSDKDPYELNLTNAKQTPSAANALGTDRFGRDILTRIMYGARTTLIVAIGSRVVALVTGAILGLLCGYYTPVEKVLMRILDGFATIPNLLLCLMMVSIFGAGTINLILAMAVGGIPGTARNVRNLVLSLREKEFIESEKAMGASDLRTIFLHILPSCASYLLVSFSSGLAGAVLSMTSLSYLGLGLSPIIPSWGGMINESQSFMFGTPHMVFYPALAVCITVFGFSMLGDGVRDLLDPKLR